MEVYLCLASLYNLLLVNADGDEGCNMQHLELHASVILQSQSYVYVKRKG